MIWVFSIIGALVLAYWYESTYMRIIVFVSSLCLPLVAPLFWFALVIIKPTPKHLEAS